MRRGKLLFALLLTAMLLAATCRAESDVKEYVTMQPGSAGTDVARLQAKLFERNYFHDAVDGDYGSRTETAVKLLQQDMGLPQTGIADAETQAALENTEHAFVPQANNQLTLYYGEYDSAQHIMRLYFKNTGSTVVTACQFVEQQCDEAKNPLGNFLGSRNSGGSEYGTTYTSPSTFVLGPGSNYVVEMSDFYEGNAEMQFFPEGKYACYYISTATTKEGTVFSGEGNNLYVEFR